MLCSKRKGRHAVQIWLILGGILLCLLGLRFLRGPYRSLNARQAQEYLDLSAAYPVDVRTPSEQARGIIPGALCLPLDQIERRSAEIPVDRPMLIYCASGMRSRLAASILCRQGRKDIANLSGGIGAWIAAKLPLEKPRPSSR